MTRTCQNGRRKSETMFVNKKQTNFFPSSCFPVKDPSNSPEAVSFWTQQQEQQFLTRASLYDVLEPSFSLFVFTNALNN